MPLSLDKVSTRFHEYVRLGKIGFSTAVITATIGVCAVHPRVMAHVDPQPAGVLEEFDEPVDCGGALDEVTRACQAQLEELSQACDAADGSVSTGPDACVAAVRECSTGCADACDEARGSIWYDGLAASTCPVAPPGTCTCVCVGEDGEPGDSEDYGPTTTTRAACLGTEAALESNTTCRLGASHGAPVGRFSCAWIAD